MHKGVKGRPLVSCHPRPRFQTPSMLGPSARSASPAEPALLACLVLARSGLTLPFCDPTPAYFSLLASCS